MSLKFYKCNRCGNVFEVLVDSKVTPMCCGKFMDELVPNTVDASNEKHVPVINVEGNKVEVVVGSVEHPMIEAHFITNIILETNKQVRRVKLSPNQEPKATFYLAEGEEVIAAYEYCNLHGLWKKEYNK
ncbi:MAG: desulfoferrodoxin Dfx [Bacilli bacterium]|nr:desulfoferrodoxin Dfx [Bacilli bacterium]